MNGMGQTWLMLLNWIIGLLVVTVVAWIIIRAVNHQNNVSRRITKSPLDILKKKYVRGKIGRKEYVKRRSTIL